MKASILLFAIIILSAALPGLSHAQGSLTPPPGVPAPTQKSLQQIWDKLASVEQQNQQLSAALFSLGQAQGLKPAPLFALDAADAAITSSQRTDLAFGPDGQPAITYYDAGAIRLARFNGAVWSFEIATAGSASYHHSLAFGPTGQPVIAYYDPANQDLKLATFNGATWSTQTVDATGRVGEQCSLAFGTDGQPVIAYLDFTNGKLKVARWNSVLHTWQNDVVDTAAVSYAAISLAISNDGKPAVAYNRASNLYYAKWNGAAWTTQAVLISPGTPTYLSLAFAPDGQPAISAVDDFTSADLYYAKYNGVSWASALVDGGGPAGYEYHTLAFGPDGQPAIAYRGANKLKYAHFVPGSGWQLQTLDATESRAVSLAFGPDGRAAISYFHSNESGLRVARGLPGTGFTP